FVLVTNGKTRFEILRFAQNASCTAEFVLRHTYIRLKTGVTGWKPHARWVRARARRFRREFFARPRLDECHRANSTRGRPPLLAGDMERAPRCSWTLGRRIFCRMRRRNRPPSNWAIALLRSQRARSDFALSPYL